MCLINVYGSGICAESMFKAVECRSTLFTALTGIDVKEGKGDHTPWLVKYPHNSCCFAYSRYQQDFIRNHLPRMSSLLQNLPYWHIVAHIHSFYVSIVTYTHDTSCQNTYREKEGHLWSGWKSPTGQKKADVIGMFSCHYRDIILPPLTLTWTPDSVNI